MRFQSLKIGRALMMMLFVCLPCAVEADTVNKPEESPEISGSIGVVVDGKEIGVVQRSAVLSGEFACINRDEKSSCGVGKAGLSVSGNGETMWNQPRQEETDHPQQGKVQGREGNSEDVHYSIWA